MDSIEPSALEAVFVELQDGQLFEKLAQRLMSAIQGSSFSPVGGIHDKGIDGLEYIWQDNAKQPLVKIYQFSIRKDSKTKIRETAKKLKSNGINYDQLVYGTNQIIPHPHELVDEILADFGVLLHICDLPWFANQINQSPQAVRSFNEFLKQHVVFRNRPVRGFELIDVADPRIYVFLRQMVDHPGESRKLDEILVDTLIIMALEGTASSKQRFRSKKEVLTEMQSIRRFDDDWLDKIVTERLNFFATKPRTVRHHRKEDVYCLPYETWLDLEISQRNDEKLYDGFMEQSISILEAELGSLDVDLSDACKLLEKTFHELFHQQGLEFSEFLSSGDGSTSLDKSLQDIVMNLVNEFKIVAANRQPLGGALLNTVREIVYNGSAIQLEFLRRLASTYRMLFLLQCDPKLASFFEEMARNLVVYVDTSILIPAFSEYFLDKKNQRHANLLRCAADAGITLKVTNIVINELSAHFKRIKRTFGAEYENRERIFEDKANIRYIDDMLIRAYFHAKHAGEIHDFQSYYQNFLLWNSSNEAGELVAWLESAFGIQYEEISGMYLHIDPQEEEELFERLRTYKPTDEQASSDVKQLLHIYAVREKNNELGEGGAFGYNTWWLTSDTSTQRAFADLGFSYTRKNPYIRADFFYSYIELAPSRHDVKRIYEKVFPTLLGVNISYFVPEEVRQAFFEHLQEQKNVADSPAYRGRVRSMSEGIKQGR